MRPSLPSAVAVLMSIAVLTPPGAAAQEQGPLQTVSLLGRELFAQPIPDSELERMQAALEEAPEEAEAWMQYGIALSGSWHYRDAIAAYSHGLHIDPFRALLYRHRGHRYISLRRFEEAAADLQLSARLDPSNWDTWYHLGLAYYLLGQFDDAAEAYRRCYSITGDAGSLVAVSDWYWMTLMRLGRTEDAERLLVRIRPDMEVGENTAYHRRLLMYKGELSPEDLLDIESADDLQLATLAYGLGNYHLVMNRREQAMEVFRKVVAGPYWPAFGFIAAEAELAGIR